MGKKLEKDAEEHLTLIIPVVLHDKLRAKADEMAYTKSQLVRGLILGFVAGVCDPFAYLRPPRK